MVKRKLPISGVQTFSKLRNEYEVYVDKTRHVYEMASRYTAVFLSRPRRFGKSLLCSTIEALFKGQKELFTGLAVEKTNWEWKEHPVIHLGLGADNFTENSLERLVGTINKQFDYTCCNYGISVDKNSSIANRFARIITALSDKFDRVVIIIDEYDNSLMNTINQVELNQKLREELKGFFSVIKQYDAYIRFAFVTGVTKFSQVSMFSGFNQSKDISMEPEYCDICGVTQEELESCFAPEIEMYAQKYGGRLNYLDKLREYYNGYFFTEENVSVYNIYGLLNHFDSGAKFAPFWSISGWPTFAVKYFEMKNVNVSEIEEAKMRAKDFGDYRDDTITLFPLLYQAGYLTISGYDEKTGFYKLNYPNIEVRQSLAEYLSSKYSQVDEILKSSTSERLVKSLLENRTQEFFTMLKMFLTKVDYSLSSRITEYYFEFAVSNIINMLGLRCVNEVHTANGRIDSVIFAGKYIYIFEFKIDKPVEDAMWQIEDKDYASIYADSGKQLIKVGIVFSRETRNIVEWAINNE
ncbi:MAG: ATP-binding protein [Treponema sp.]|nr:ATP-binding protein [Treponema sp.]